MLGEFRFLLSHTFPSKYAPDYFPYGKYKYVTGKVVELSIGTTDYCHPLVIKHMSLKNDFNQPGQILKFARIGLQIKVIERCPLVYFFSHLHYTYR